MTTTCTPPSICASKLMMYSGSHPYPRVWQLLLLVWWSISNSSHALKPAWSRTTRRDVFSQSMLAVSSLAPFLVIPHSSAVSFPAATTTTPTTNNPNNTPFVNSDSWTGTRLSRMTLHDATTTTGELWPMGRWPDPLLRVPAESVSIEWFGTMALQRACTLLQNTARHYHAVGLAAQQCGVNARIIYLENRRFPFPSNKKSLMMVNPQIVQRSSELDMRVWTEHCLVLPPTFAATVLRDAWITVEYQEATTGAWKSITLQGEMARAAQHELDHDRGILVTDHVELLELENDAMRSIETPGHAYRMALAYSRTVEPTSFFS